MPDNRPAPDIQVRGNSTLKRTSKSAYNLGCEVPRQRPKGHGLRRRARRPQAMAGRERGARKKTLDARLFNV